MGSSTADDFIKVAVRIRPKIKREIKNEQSEHWGWTNNEVFFLEDNGRANQECFTFDYVFGTETTNKDMYEVVRPIVQQATQGINGTVFAYGQTSSGKTHSIMGNPQDLGIIPQAIDDIFSHIENNNVNRKFLIRASYIEIYNEKIYDLLNTTQKDLKIREDISGNVSVKSTEEITRTREELLSVIHEGNKKRQIGETNMNDRSSRSHVIFQIIIESSEQVEEDNQNTPVQVSNLYLVDLAGSERVAQTKATGTRLKEGGHINKSLSVLSLVMQQLSSKQEHISFRDSKLTRILSNALGGNSKTLIIATVTPVSIENTLSTLMFAKCAKTIMNQPRVNEILTEAALIKQHQQKEKMLLKELQSEKEKNITLENDKHIKDNKIKVLEEKLKKIRRDFVTIKAVPVSKIPKRRHTSAFERIKEVAEPIIPATPRGLPSIFDDILESSNDFFLDRAKTPELVDISHGSLEIPSTPVSILKSRLESLNTSHVQLKEFQSDELRVALEHEQELTSELEKLKLKLKKEEDERKRSEQLMKEFQERYEKRDITCSEVEIELSFLNKKYTTREQELLSKLSEQTQLNEKYKDFESQMYAMKREREYMSEIKRCADDFKLQLETLEKESIDLKEQRDKILKDYSVLKEEHSITVSKKQLFMKQVELLTRGVCSGGDNRIQRTSSDSAIYAKVNEEVDTRAPLLLEQTNEGSISNELIGELKQDLCSLETIISSRSIEEVQSSSNNFHLQGNGDGISVREDMKMMREKCKKARNFPEEIEDLDYFRIINEKYIFECQRLERVIKEFDAMVKAKDREIATLKDTIKESLKKLDEVNDQLTDTTYMKKAEHEEVMIKISEQHKEQLMNEVEKYNQISKQYCDLEEEMLRRNAEINGFKTNVSELNEKVEAYKKVIDKQDSNLQTHNAEMGFMKRNVDESCLALEEANIKIASLTSKLNSTEEELGHLRRRLRQSEESRDKAESEMIKKLKSKLDEARNEIDEMSNDIMDKIGFIETQEKTLKNSQNDIEQLNVKLTLSTENLKVSEENLKQTKELLFLAQDELLKAKKDEKHTQDQQTETNEHLQELQNDLKVTKEHLSAAQEDLIEVKKVLSVAQEDLKQCKEGCNHAEQEFRQSQQVVATTQELLKQSQQDVKQLQEQLEHSKEELQQAQQELKHSKEELQQAQQEFEDSHENLKQTQHLLSKSQETLQKIQENHEDDVKKFEEKIYELQGELTQLQMQAENYTNLNIPQADAIDEVLQKPPRRSEKLEADFKEPEKDLNEEQVSIENDRKQEETQVQLEKVCDDLKQAYKDLSQAHDVVIQLQVEAANYKNFQETREAVLQESQDKLQDELKQAYTNLTHSQEEVEKGQEYLKQLLCENEHLKKDLQEKEIRVEEHETVKKLTEDLKQAQEEIQQSTVLQLKLQENIEHLEKQVNLKLKLEEDIEALQNALDVKEKQIDAMREDLEEANRKYNEINEIIAQQNEKLKELSQQDTNVLQEALQLKDKLLEEQKEIYKKLMDELVKEKDQALETQKEAFIKLQDNLREEKDQTIKDMEEKIKKDQNLLLDLYQDVEHLQKEKEEKEKLLEEQTINLEKLQEIDNHEKCLATIEEYQIKLLETEDHLKRLLEEKDQAMSLLEKKLQEDLERARESKDIIIREYEDRLKETVNVTQATEDRLNRLLEDKNQALKMLETKLQENLEQAQESKDIIVTEYEQKLKENGKATEDRLNKLQEDKDQALNMLQVNLEKAQESKDIIIREYEEKLMESVNVTQATEDRLNRLLEDKDQALHMLEMKLQENITRAKESKDIIMREYEDKLKESVKVAQEEKDIILKDLEERLNKYKILLEGTQEEKDNSLRQLEQKLQENQCLLENALEEKDLVLREHKGTIQEKQELLDEKQRILKVHEETLQEHQRLVGKIQELEHLDNILKNKEIALKQQEQTISDLQNSIHQLEEKIEALEQCLEKKTQLLEKGAEELECLKNLLIFKENEFEDQTKKLSDIQEINKKSLLHFEEKEKELEELENILKDKEKAMVNQEQTLLENKKMYNELLDKVEELKKCPVKYEFEQSDQSKTLLKNKEEELIQQGYALLEHQERNKHLLNRIQELEPYVEMNKKLQERIHELEPHLGMNNQLAQRIQYLEQFLQMSKEAQKDQRETREANLQLQKQLFLASQEINQLNTKIIQLSSKQVFPRETEMITKYNELLQKNQELQRQLQSENKKFVELNQCLENARVEIRTLIDDHLRQVKVFETRLVQGKEDVKRLEAVLDEKIKVETILNEQLAQVKNDFELMKNRENEFGGLEKVVALEKHLLYMKEESTELKVEMEAVKILNEQLKSEIYENLGIISAYEEYLMNIIDGKIENSIPSLENNSKKKRALLFEQIKTKLTDILLKHENGNCKPELKGQQQIDDCPVPNNEIESLKKDLRAKEEELEQLKQDNETLDQEVIGFQEIVERQNEEIKDMKKQMEIKREELETLKQDNETLDLEVVGFQEIVERQKKEVEDLEKQIEELKAKNEHLDKEVVGSLDHIKSLDTAQVNLNKEIRQKNGIIKELQQRLDSNSARGCANCINLKLKLNSMQKLKLQADVKAVPRVSAMKQEECPECKKLQEKNKELGAKCSKLQEECEKVQKSKQHEQSKECREIIYTEASQSIQRVHDLLNLLRQTEKLTGCDCCNSFLTLLVQLHNEVNCLRSMPEDLHSLDNKFVKDEQRIIDLLQKIVELPVIQGTADIWMRLNEELNMRQADLRRYKKTNNLRKVFLTEVMHIMNKCESTFQKYYNRLKSNSKNNSCQSCPKSKKFCELIFKIKERVASTIPMMEQMDFPQLASLEFYQFLFASQDKYILPLQEELSSFQYVEPQKCNKETETELESLRIKYNALSALAVLRMEKLKTVVQFFEKEGFKVLNLDQKPGDIKISRNPLRSSCPNENKPISFDDSFNLDKARSQAMNPFPFPSKFKRSVSTSANVRPPTLSDQLRNHRSVYQISDTNNINELSSSSSPNSGIQRKPFQ